MENPEKVIELFKECFEIESKNSAFSKRYTDYHSCPITDYDFVSGTYFSQKSENKIVASQYNNVGTYIEISIPISINKMAQNVTINSLSLALNYIIDCENNIFIDFINNLPFTYIDPNDELKSCEDGNNFLIGDIAQKEIDYENGLKIKNNIFITTDRLKKNERLLMKDIKFCSFCPRGLLGDYSQFDNKFIFSEQIVFTTSITNGSIFRYSPDYVKPKSIEEAIFSATNKDKTYYLDF